MIRLWVLWLVCVFMLTPLLLDCCNDMPGHSFTIYDRMVVCLRSKIQTGLKGSFLNTRQ